MSTIPVVYNDRCGGFRLSNVALSYYNELRVKAGLSTVEYCDDIDRTDPLLVQVIRELGKEANHNCSSLVIKEIPLEYATCYKITQYDGLEKIICDPATLIGEKLSKLDLNSMSDNECREMLSSLIKLIRPL